MSTGLTRSMLLAAFAISRLVAQIPMTPEDLIARNLGPRDRRLALS
jgi:hypothetical protein